MHRRLLPLVDSGDVDVVALQIVTVGNEATQRFEKLQGANEYTEAFYSHGLAGRSGRSGGRVDAPAHPEASWESRDAASGTRGATARVRTSTITRMVFKLLPAEEALGMDLTEAFQLIPEQCTAAVIIHHPQAKYYAVRGAGTGTSTEPEAAVA